MVIDYVDYFCQLVITCTGFFSLYLFASQDLNVRMKAGNVGLIGEPFLFATAFINEQYGVLILVLVYGINWIRIIHSNYIQIQNEKLNRISL